ncbi:MAG: hypothetical protein CEE43_18990 [Promethearchaeota archaeon Loki_b32]|nr:MAG: hypothetical protein CEE43_18990 [Candidatus Lokiarchaeota archaeon Loki_b32]
MPVKSLMEQCIEAKAKRHEVIDYEELNGKFKKCEFCDRLFHPSGFYKHKTYCSLNPNRKISYKTKRKWKCRYCSLLFKHNKERNLHEGRCAENPNAVIIQSRINNQDKLNLFKHEFPEIYEILTPNQIKEFLDSDR